MKLTKKLALCWRILKANPGNYMIHAERELPPAVGDDMQSLMNDQLKEMVLVFATHGHSGFSSSYAVSALEKLLLFKPLGPLTGADDEWYYHAGEDLYQNKRCSHVFKESDGSAYDINGRVFREPNGACFTNSDSRVPVIFPYVPRTEYVDVPSTAED